MILSRDFQKIVVSEGKVKNEMKKTKQKICSSNLLQLVRVYPNIDKKVVKKYISK